MYSRCNFNGIWFFHAVLKCIFFVNFHLKYSPCIANNELSNWKHLEQTKCFTIMLTRHDRLILVCLATTFNIIVMCMVVRADVRPLTCYVVKLVLCVLNIFKNKLIPNLHNQLNLWRNNTCPSKRPQAIVAYYESRTRLMYSVTLCNTAACSASDHRKLPSNLCS